MHGDGCERQQEEEAEGVTESAAGQQAGSLLLTDGPAGWLAASQHRRLPPDGFLAGPGQLPFSFRIPPW